MGHQEAAAVLTWLRLPYLPRARGVAYSTSMAADPAHSPATAKPWNSRSTTRSTGAATPMVR